MKSDENVLNSDESWVYGERKVISILIGKTLKSLCETPQRNVLPFLDIMITYTYTYSSNLLQDF